jgi:hypothetical protein
MPKQIPQDVRDTFNEEVTRVKEGLAELGVGYPGKELDSFFGMKVNHSSMKNTWNLRNVNKGNLRKIQAFYNSRKSICQI